MKATPSPWWPWVIFVLAAGCRVLWIGSVPGGLNQDEASTGYDAWALLTAGIDRHGQSWPVHFISWGSGQNALYAYLALPFLALFGPSILTLRLAAGLLGVVSLYGFWRLGHRQSPKLGQWTLLLLATSPWHIMMSRWALESNAAPAVVLMAVLCFARVPERPRYLLWGSALLAMSVYAYGTCYLFAPLFLLGAGLVLYRQIRPTGLRRGALIVGAAVIAALVAAPIMLFIWNNRYGSTPLHLGPITIPLYPSEARYSSLFLPLAPDGWGRVPSNIQTVLQLWLQGRSDGLTWNASDAFGAQYAWLTPFLVLGIVYAAKSRNVTDHLMLVWLACAVATACLTEANVNRINLIWIPSLWIAARSLTELIQPPLFVRWAKAACVLLGTTFMLHYVYVQQRQIADAFYVGFEESLREVLAQADAQAPIAVTGQVPYTLVLYLARPDPHAYLASVEVEDVHAPFQVVKRFTRFIVGNNYSTSAVTPTFFVVHISELSAFDAAALAGRFIIRVHGQFASVVPAQATSEKAPARMQLLSLTSLTGQQDYGTLRIGGEVDNNAEGLPIANQLFTHGFGVHGDSRWEAALPIDNAILQVGYGIATRSDCSDGMDFQIEVDNQVVFHRRITDVGTLQFVNLPIQRANLIRFVTRAGNTNFCDHGLWIMPSLLYGASQ